MKADEILHFNIIPQVALSNKQIVVEDLCNAFTAINVGAVLAEVNGVPLNAGVPGTNNGESVSFGGNKGELYKGRIDISFPAVGVGKVIVIQKIYLPDELNNYNE